MTDFRALCKELVGTWDAKSELGFSDWRNKTADIVERARAALAEQPVWPTDEELWEAWGCFEHEPFSKGDTIMQLREFLARWGTSNLAQVRSSLGDHQLLVEDDGLFGRADTALAAPELQPVAEESSVAEPAALAEQPVWPMDKLDRLIALDRDDPTNALPTPKK